LLKYGNIARTPSFYSTKIFRAFYNPGLPPEIINGEEYSPGPHGVFAERFFEYFAYWFGFINFQRESNALHLRSQFTLTKSPLLDKLFWNAPGS
jgi:hypothetical protein